MSKDLMLPKKEHLTFSWMVPSNFGVGSDFSYGQLFANPYCMITQDPL